MHRATLKLGNGMTTCYLVYQLHTDGWWLDFQHKVWCLVMLQDPCWHMHVSVEYTKFIGMCLKRMWL